MTFKVIITPRAQEDANEYVALIAKDSVSQALAWIDGVLESTEDLAELPLRYPLVSEAESLGQDIRSYPHHSHRVIYWVDRSTSTVFVLRIYHMARRPLRRGDLAW